MWISYALVYALLTSLHIPIIKKISTRAGSLGYIFQNALFVVPALVVLTLLTTGVPQIGEWFWFHIIIAAVIEFVGIYLMVKAFQISEISYVTPIGSLTPLLVTVFGLLFLNEQIHYVGWIGILFIISGAYLLNVEEERTSYLQPFKRLFKNQGARLFVAANIVFAFYPVFLKQALHATEPFAPFWVALVLETIMMLLAAVFLLRSKTKLVPIRKHLWLFVASATIVCLQLFTEFTSYNSGDIGKVSAIFKLSVLFTVIWGFFFFKEKHIYQRIIAASVMLFGVSLLAM